MLLITPRSENTVTLPTRLFGEQSVLVGPDREVSCRMLHLPAAEVLRP
jgi:hypothetical protein